MQRDNILSVVTFNTQGILAFSPDYFRKIAKVADLINKQEVDIVSFQEVFFYQHFLYLKNRMQTFPYYTYKPALFGPRAGLVTFSRQPLLNFTYADFSKMGNIFDKSLISRLGKKGMLISYHEKTDTYIINTHFSANFSNDWDVKNRDTLLLERQLDELQELMLQITGRYILCGDFNIQKDSYLYRKLRSIATADVFENSRRATHRGDYFVDASKKLQSDYILFDRNNFVVTDMQYILDQKARLGGRRKFLSDHIGLQATFRAL